MRYKLFIKKNHLIILDDSKYYMIDTGSPINIDFNKGQTFGKASQSDFEKFLDFKIDGIYGLPFLRKFNNMIVCKKEQELAFNENITFNYEKANELKVNNNCIEVLINGKRINAFFDTGAHIPIINRNIIDKYKIINKINELTQIGYRTLFEIQTNILIGNRVVNSGLIMDSQIERYTQGFSLFIGPGEIYNNYFLYDFKNNKIIFD